MIALAAKLQRYAVGPRGCWLWSGAVDQSGYAKVRHCGAMRLVHRLAFEAWIGPIPEGLQPDHRCHTDDDSCPGGVTCPHRRCINPHHLELVTKRENTLRGRGPTAANARKNACDKGHEFTVENTYIRPNGNRDCRQCIRDRVRAYRIGKAAS